MLRAVLTAGFLVLLVFSAVGAEAAGPVKVGKVVGLKGAAVVVHEGDKEAVALRLKDPVYLMDRITTEKRSRVKLLMDDDSILTLGQGGELVISEYAYRPAEGSRKSILKLIAGNIRCVISRFFAGAESRFEVHTPTAVAGARGTVNITSVISPERTLVVGQTGKTGARNVDPAVEGDVELTDNCGSYVDRGKPPGEVFCLSEEMLGPLVADTTVGRAPEFEPGEFGPETPGMTPEGAPQTPVPETPPVEQQPPPPPPAPVDPYLLY